MTLSLKNEPRINVKNILSFQAKYTHAKMASHEEKHIKVEPRIYVLSVFELDSGQ